MIRLSFSEIEGRSPERDEEGAEGLVLDYSKDEDVVDLYFDDDI